MQKVIQKPSGIFHIVFSLDVKLLLLLSVDKALDQTNSIASTLIIFYSFSYVSRCAYISAFSLYSMSMRSPPTHN